jgi:hypothetical protein
MSDTVNNDVAAKMDVLFGKVYLPTLMNKLAERGVAPETEDELNDILKIAMLARTHASAPQQANPAASVVKQAAQSLETFTLGPRNQLDAILADPDVRGVFQS